MSLDMFAEPDFFSLLKFWETSRNGAELPSWDHLPASLPEVLLPNLIVSEHRPPDKPPFYTYLGSEIIRRWGADVTGEKVYDVLRGPMGAYVRHVEDDTLARKLPIFSEAIYGRAEVMSLLVTGRLFAPFCDPQSCEVATYVFGVQFFRGSPWKLQQLNSQSLVEEVERQLISNPRFVCEKLTEGHWEIDARGFPRAASEPKPQPQPELGRRRRRPQRRVETGWAATAREIAREALTPLPRLTSQTA